MAGRPTFRTGGTATGALPLRGLRFLDIRELYDSQERARRALMWGDRLAELTGSRNVLTEHVAFVARVGYQVPWVQGSPPPQAVCAVLSLDRLAAFMLPAGNDVVYIALACHIRITTSSCHRLLLRTVRVLRRKNRRKQRVKFSLHRPKSLYVYVLPRHRPHSTAFSTKLESSC